MSNINNITELSIILTQNCNLSCSYCTQKHSKTNMNFNTIKKFMNDYNFFELDKVINIELFGGEPLLNFNLIKEFVYYLDDNLSNYQKKLIHFKLNTNGTIYSDEIVEFLKYIGKTFNLNLIFSYDALHQFKRSRDEITSTTIQENINKYLNTCLIKISRISFSIFNESILKNILYIKSIFPVTDNRIKFYLIREPYEYTEDIYNNTINNLKIYYLYLLQLRSQNYELFKNVPYIIDKLNEFNNAKNGCNMGYTKFTLLPNYNKTNKLSNCGLDNSFEYDDIIEYQKIEENCKDCEIKNYCNKICPKKIFYKNKINKNYLCEIKKFEFEYLTKYFEEFKKFKNQGE